MKLKKPRKKTVVLACLAAVGVVAVGAMLMMPRPPVALPVQSVALETTELVSNISATGRVESASASYVYTNLGSTIQEVHVRVGDRVEAGAVLCELDTAKLELDIAQQEADISKTLSLSQHNISVSERKYDEATQNIEQNLNESISAAQGNMKAAKLRMDNTLADYDRAKRDLDEEDEDYDEDDTFTVGASRTSLRQLKDAKTAAARAYDDARMTYRNAVAQAEVAGNSVNQSLETYQDSIEESRLSANMTSGQIALQKLRMNLADSTLTAPAAGTVTAVYAEEGAIGNGLLFVVENTDNLIVKTHLREYDIATVREGMPATIKSDATGETIFDGQVSKIYPTAMKAADGTTRTDGTVEFETDVDLLTAESGLRIGMNVRLNIITEKKENVWAVPFDAVTTDEQGQKIVYVARLDEETQTTVAVAVPVETGMETDFSIEIASDGLQEGDVVVADPSGVLPGSLIAVAPSTGMMNGGTLAVGLPPEDVSSEDAVSEESSAESSASDASSGDAAETTGG